MHGLQLIWVLDVLAKPLVVQQASGDVLCSSSCLCTTELLLNALLLSSCSSHKQLPRLVCAEQSWWLTEHLSCEVCEDSDSHKAEVLQDPLSGSH